MEQKRESEAFMDLGNFNEIQAHRAVKALVDSIDNDDQHNDVVIVLEDGDIQARKLILSSRSEFFQKMFNKKSEFCEQTENEVYFPCKKKIMRKILEHIYGGNLVVFDLSCVEIIEMMDMLRFLLLKDSFDVLENYLKKMILAMKIPIEECIEAVETADSLILENSSKFLTACLAANFDRIRTDHEESIEDLSENVVSRMLNIDCEMEKRHGLILLQRHKLNRLEFIQIWLKSNPMTVGLRNDIRHCFDLETFHVDNLLGDVRNSNLFSDNHIFGAVDKIVQKEKKFLENVKMVAEDFNKER